MALKHISDILARLDAIKFAYESPPEESLGERIAQSLAPSVTFCTQSWVDTAAGPFRLDMLLVHPSGRRIAIEVDGQDFHEPNRDRWRTVFILCAGGADVVYRVPAVMVYKNLLGVLAGLATVEPRFFDAARTTRWKESSRDRWEFASAEDDYGEAGNYGFSDSTSGRDDWTPSSRPFTVNFRLDFADCSHEVLTPYVEFAKATGLRDIDLLSKAWKERRRALNATKSRPSDAIDDWFAELMREM